MSENSASVSDHNEHEKEDDESNAITMVDVLKEECELEEDANAVLGGSDPQNCTYPNGYVKRQALYACLTCIPPTKAEQELQPGGLCLACSYSCHEGHELVELYTKRNFRCDCGSGAFGANKCNLETGKDENKENKYNHNFQGLYCICNRPYPDPDDTVGDDMIQCIVCEDWYHGRHLGSESSVPNDYGEMICESCMGEHNFLWKYASLCLTKKNATENTVDVCGTPSKACGSKSTMESATPETPASASEGSPQKPCDSSVSQQGESGCVVPELRLVPSWKGATFWPEGWRKQLCVCSDCQKVYVSEGVEYLTDMQDTVQYYEEQGKAKAANGVEGSQYDRAMQALSKLDRVKQVEAIHGYNDMKDQLKEYLQKFAENRKVVREEDIREFFSQMARKRQRVDLPTFCR